jgi:hypothetical protein
LPGLCDGATRELKFHNPTHDVDEPHEPPDCRQL